MSIDLKSPEEDKMPLANLSWSKENEIVRVHGRTKLICSRSVGGAVGSRKGECEVGVGGFAWLLEECMPLFRVFRVIKDEALSKP